MSVENFFPGHYPWQRLLSDIHKKLVPEESEDDEMYVKWVYDSDNDTATIQYKAGELLEAAKTKLIYCVSEYSDSYNLCLIVTSYYDTFDSKYKFRVFNFTEMSDDTYSASSENDYPACDFAS